LASQGLNVCPGRPAKRHKVETWGNHVRRHLNDHVIQEREIVGTQEGRRREKPKKITETRSIQG